MPSGDQLTRLLWRADKHRTAAALPSMVKRTTNMAVSVERVDFRSAAHSKTQQAWRYKGNLVARAPSVTINGRKLVDNKLGPNGESGLARRKQESNFFLTINPNLAPRDGPDVERVTAAVQKMVDLLGTDAGVKSILKFGPKDPHFSDDRFEDVILNIDWKPGVEMGGIQGRVHAHTCGRRSRTSPRCRSTCTSCSTCAGTSTTRSSREARSTCRFPLRSRGKSAPVSTALS